MLSRAQVTARLSISMWWARELQSSGRLCGIIADDKGTWMYDPGAVEQFEDARRENKNTSKAQPTASRTPDAS